VRRSVSADVYEFTRARLIEANLVGWTDAYGRSGHGSTVERARVIRDIYEDAAPVPGVIINPQTRDFLDEIRALVHEAISKGRSDGG
jgi:hypothetical protein